MDAVQAYKIYLSLKLHFTKPNYDIRTDGILQKIPKNKKISYTFQKKSNVLDQKQWIEYLIANFAAGDPYGGAFRDGTDQYLDWKRRKESLRYVFKQDLTTMKEHARLGSVEASLELSVHSHPPLLKLYLGKKICIETLVILNKVYKYISTLDQKLADDIMWQEVSHLIKKYSPFVEADAIEFSNLVQEIFG